MIRLNRHIEILLLGNDCVIVPGFGGFIAHHVDARIDERDGMLLPPTRTLGFNPQLTMNDSLLAQSYAEAYDISFPEAVRQIEHDVAALRKRLDDDGQAELHGIGTLTVNTEGKIIFTPNEAGILTPQFYGLGSVSLTKRTQRLAQPQAAATAVMGGTEPATGRLIYIDREAGSGHKMLNVRLDALRNVAVAAIFIAAFFLVSNPTEKQWNPASYEMTRSGILYDLFTEGMTKAEKSEEISLAAAMKTAPEQKATSKQVAKKPAAAVPTHNYWSIVLCSHVPQKNAELFVEQLKADGISGATINNQGSSIKVLYGHYASESAAQEQLRAMKGKKHFEQAWILHVE